MIEYKTAVLLGAAMNMVAIVADASEDCKTNSYEFGRNLGIAFQLQDDYFDCFGNPETFGKQIGGDIIANKKTYLYLKTLQNCSPSEAEQLIKLFTETPEDPSGKIKFVKGIYKSSGAAEASVKEILCYTEKANSILNNINISEENKAVLKSFGEKLMKRNV
jgi:geranylgeranyl diphosphate synthase type II